MINTYFSFGFFFFDLGHILLHILQPNLTAIGILYNGFYFCVSQFAKMGGNL